MRPSQKAWLAGAVGILGFNLTMLLLGRDDEQLSKQVDRWRTEHPIVVHTVIELVHRHLTRELPEAVDPIGLLFVAASHLRRERRRH